MTTIKVDTEKVFTHSLAALTRGDWFQFVPSGDFYIKLAGDNVFDVRNAFEVDANPAADVI